MTDRLHRLADIVAKRTPGPWHQMAGASWNVLHDKGYRIVTCGTDGNFAEDGSADAAFIAAMGSCADELLAALDQARTARAGFFDRAAHGDDAHRAWLKAEIDLVFSPFDRAIAALDRRLAGVLP